MIKFHSLQIAMRATPNIQWQENHKKPWIADTPAKVGAVNALGLAAPIRLGDQTPYWPIDKGYAKHA